MGSDARTIQAGLKITEQERAALENEFGSMSKGLRALLNEHATKRQPDPIPHEHQGHPMLDDDVAVTRAAAHDLGIPEPERFGQEVEAVAPDLMDPRPMAGTAEAALTGVAAPPVHRHKRKTLDHTEFHHGTKVQVWLCECGAELR